MRQEEKEKKKPLSAKEIRFRRRSRWSVGIAIAAVVGYLLTGELITFVFSEDEEGGIEVDGSNSTAQPVEELEEPLDDDDAEEPPPEEDE